MGSQNMVIIGVIGAVLLMMTMGRTPTRNGPNVAYLRPKRTFDFINVDTSSPTWQAD